MADRSIRHEMKVVTNRCYHLLLILQHGCQELESSLVQQAVDRALGLASLTLIPSQRLIISSERFKLSTKNWEDGYRPVVLRKWFSRRGMQMKSQNVIGKLNVVLKSYK